MPLANVKVLCTGHDNECVKTMQIMKELGYSKIKEVYNIPDADITAQFYYDYNVNVDSLMKSLAEKRDPYVIQIGFEPINPYCYNIRNMIVGWFKNLSTSDPSQVV